MLNYFKVPMNLLHRQTYKHTHTHTVHTHNVHTHTCKHTQTHIYYAQICTYTNTPMTHTYTPINIPID